MNGSVIAIAFTEDELTLLRQRMRDQDEVHISSVIRRAFGFPSRYVPPRWLMADDFEEIDQMKKLVNAVYFLAAHVSALVAYSQNVESPGHPVDQGGEGRRIAEQLARDNPDRPEEMPLPPAPELPPLTTLDEFLEE